MAHRFRNMNTVSYLMRVFGETPSLECDTWYFYLLGGRGKQGQSVVRPTAQPTDQPTDRLTGRPAGRTVGRPVGPICSSRVCLGPVYGTPNFVSCLHVHQAIHKLSWSHLTWYPVVIGSRNFHPSLLEYNTHPRNTKLSQFWNGSCIGTLRSSGPTRPRFTAHGQISRPRSVTSMPLLPQTPSLSWPS